MSLAKHLKQSASTQQPAEHTGLPETAIVNIRHMLKQYPTVKAAILYGSRTIGTFRTGSDIDLTLTGDVDWQDSLKIERRLDGLMLPWEIDLSIYDQIDNRELLEHIDRIGVAF